MSRRLQPNPRRFAETLFRTFVGELPPGHGVVSRHLHGNRLPLSPTSKMRIRGALAPPFRGDLGRTGPVIPGTNVTPRPSTNCSRRAIRTIRPRMPTMDRLLPPPRWLSAWLSDQVHPRRKRRPALVAQGIEHRFPKPC